MMSNVKIVVDSDVCDCTYFRTGDVEPRIDAERNCIVVYDGRGSKRSWGSPQVSTHIAVQRSDFVAIHIGWSHKHGGGQTWRYYRVDELTGDIKRVLWRQLPDTLRILVIDALRASWRNSPGKLRQETSRVSATV